MKTKCPIKEPFIMKMLDELQPDWREGADVTQETKQNIMSHVEEKYRPLSDVLLEEGSITQRSIEKTIGKIRAKLGFVAKSTRKTYPKRARSDNQIHSLVPEKKRIELYETLRLIQSQYPYTWEIILDAHKNNPALFETIVKYYKKYPEKDGTIDQSMQRLKHELALEKLNSIQEEKVRWVIPQTNKELIFAKTEEISLPTISLYGCTYARSQKKPDRNMKTVTCEEGKKICK